MKTIWRSMMLVLTTLTLLLAGQGGVGNALAQRESEVRLDTLNTSVFLPSIQVPGARIAGHVLSQRTSTAGGVLQLRVYQPAGPGSSVLVASATLADDGSYLFAQVPALAQGSAYYLFYTPATADDGLLLAAYSRDVTALTADQSVDLGALDVTGIDLTSPSDGATVSMPASFAWTPRTTQSDIYYWQIVDSNGTLASLSTEDLGYLGQVSVDAFPGDAGYQLNTMYGWNIGVLMPDGSEGVSQSRHVAFSSIVTFGAPLGVTSRWPTVSGVTGDRPKR